eukprot:79753-Pelagomonas_calceolata.AAC.15
MNYSTYLDWAINTEQHVGSPFCIYIIKPQAAQSMRLPKRRPNGALHWHGSIVGVPAMRDEFLCLRSFFLAVLEDGDQA